MHASHARWVLPSVLLAVFVGCAGEQQAARTAVDPVALKATLDSLNQSFVAAVAARDTDQVVSFYAEDAHLLPAGMARADGRAAIRAAWAQFLQTPGLELALTGGEPMVTEAGDMVIDLGTYRMKMNDAKGNATEDVGKYVVVFKRANGEWKIVVDTFNSDTPPPSS